MSADTVTRTAPPAPTVTAVGRMTSLARAELTLLSRSRATFFAAVFVPLILPLSLRSTVEDMDLKGSGLSVGSVILPSAVGFSLLFAVYSSLVSVYAARREELVLKRLRTGELRDAEILMGAAVPSVLIGLVQSLVLTFACAALMDVGTPEAPLLAVLGLLLGLVMWPALAAVTASFSRSVEGAQVAAMPLLLVSMIGSGTVVPFEVMPDRLAAVCELLPLSPVITLIRGGWAGNLSAYETLGALATALAWIVLAVFAVHKWFRWEPRR
ncbi:ABC transporter permease [Streptomyces sp. BH-SS-21]|uniref:Transport permease protein n=1 Tax=Streptomyces liliiviolaceus TaxID=2823109 RepID=A0A941B754_9ACTN|nr:ABC transporter permease [Streptomyces liliiviolaceus]MBQ0847633.1 ABC transporter permease [Streptomyces liliiviolaceus]